MEPVDITDTGPGECLQMIKLTMDNLYTGLLSRHFFWASDHTGAEPKSNFC
jgi:hypothetical protein